MKNMAQDKNLGESPLLYTTGVTVVKQLIEILALGKADKVNTLLKGKEHSEAKECSPENPIQYFLKALGVSVFYKVVYRT